jgi:hypothetical protein
MKFLFSFLIVVLIAGFTPESFTQTDAGGPTESAQLPIWIKNNSGTPMANTSVKLIVNTQALITLGLMQADGDDIRFASTCGPNLGTVLTYWLEGPMNSPSTVIWVRIPSVAANDSALIYMYFGNPAISGGSSPYTTLLSGPHSSTDSVATGGAGTGSPNAQRGFRFTAIADIYVTHFGKREPLGVPKYITLFDFNTQAILRQKQISGPAAQYIYDTLGSPIWLNTGQQYLLEFFSDGISYGYYFGASSQVGQHLTYGDMRYCNGCTQNTFPTTTLANQQYGYPDFWYWVPANSVTPGPTMTYFPAADTNTPTAPAGLTGIPGSSSAQLRWNKNTQFDVWKYFIYRNTTNNSGTATLIDSTTHPDTAYVAGGLTPSTTYYFWVRAVDRFCSRKISAFSTSVPVTPFVGIQTTGNEIPKVYALYQNFPNPFNPTTNISFDLPRISLTRITLYDLLGREVDVLVNEMLAAGKYNIDFNAGHLASGVYFYKIEAENFVDKRKMIIVK